MRRTTLYFNLTILQPCHRTSWTTFRKRLKRMHTSFRLERKHSKKVVNADEEVGTRLVVHTASLSPLSFPPRPRCPPQPNPNEQVVADPR